MCGKKLTTTKTETSLGQLLLLKASPVRHDLDLCAWRGTTGGGGGAPAWAIRRHVMEVVAA